MPNPPRLFARMSVEIPIPLLSFLIATGILVAQTELRINPVKDGDPTVTGNIAQGERSITVKVNGVAADQNKVTVNQGGTFSVKLSNPVKAGDNIQVTLGDGTPGRAQARALNGGNP
jgi:hypothetical protein